MLFLTIVIIYALASSARASEPKECCMLGYQRGLAFVTSSKNETCELDPSLLKFNSVFEKFSCDRIFESCCRIATVSQFCLVGVQMAVANQDCTSDHRTGGLHRETCCNCCKVGKGHGLAGGSCTDVPVRGANDTCRAAFHDCCKRSITQITPTTCKTVTCASNQNCVEGDKGASCKCNTGFREEGDACVDIDECKSGQSGCTANSQCSNTEGSFKCVCDGGYALKNDKCVAVLKCASGLEIRNGKCEDVDECLTGTQRCPLNSFCVNLVRGYTCLNRCRTPYFEVIKVSDGTKAGVCADVDECARKTGSCLKNYKCVNKFGRYDCKLVSCDAGYKFNNGFCEDIDECEDANICGPKGMCRNGYGTYYCDCHVGHSVDHETRKCADVDECKLNHNCMHGCNNTVGSYVCYCPHGYRMIKNRCVDIDECQNNPCKGPAKCFNTRGSYHCINEPCPNSFYDRLNKFQCRKKSCQGMAGDQVHRCNSIQETSIKWQAFNMPRDVGPRWFTFVYTLRGFNPLLNFHYALVSGNEEQVFGIRKQGRGKVAFFNAKTLPAAGEFKITMFADVRIGSKLFDRFVYIFYIFISPYDF